MKLAGSPASDYPLYMVEPSTNELQGWLAQLDSGDPAAREQLIKRSMERLRRLARRTLAQFPRIRNHEDTDDVLQSLLMRLLRRLEAVHPPTVADFLRLAASEVRHTLIDLTRHYHGPQGAGTREISLTPKESDVEPKAAEHSDSTYDANALADWEEFHRQIDMLPEGERDVFAMIWYSDLKQEEVATALGISIPTVKRRWLAARLRLQRWMDGEPE